MGYSTENSVTMALADIFAIENERKVAEAENERRQRQAGIDAKRAAEEEAEVRARESALRAEHQRIASEMALRDQETAARIAALRAELDAVRWSREAIRSEIRAMGARRRTGRPASSRSKPFVIGAIVISACGFGLILGWLNGRTVVASSSDMGTESVSGRALGSEPENEEASSGKVPLNSAEVTRALESVSHADAVEPAVPEATVLHRKSAPKRRQTERKWKRKSDRGGTGSAKQTKEKKHDLAFFDDCGLDPMCGFNDRNRK